MTLQPLREHQEMALPAPGCLPHQQESQPGEGSQGCCPSQASSRGHSKGDAKAHVYYQALLNERGAAAMPASLKITSGALGFKVMDPFDRTKDKAIYQRWQMWSEKARHTLDAMEGDSEKTKISYFHHWIDGKGMGKIESWRNKKILISQEDYDKLEEDEEEASTLQKR